jgi:hypothetical protein
MYHLQLSFLIHFIFRFLPFIRSHFEKLFSSSCNQTLLPFIHSPLLCIHFNFLQMYVHLFIHTITYIWMYVNKYIYRCICSSITHGGILQNVYVFTILFLFFSTLWIHFSFLQLFQFISPCPCILSHFLKCFTWSLLSALTLLLLSGEPSHCFFPSLPLESR